MRYTLDSQDLGKADRDAISRGLELIGVYHSHTHTEAYPVADRRRSRRPTPPGTTCSCRCKDEAPVMRSFRIVDGEITEEDVEVRPDG